MQEWLLEPERSEHVATVPPDLKSAELQARNCLSTSHQAFLCVSRNVPLVQKKSSERLLLKCDPVVFQQQNNLEDQVQSRHRDQDVALL